VSDVEQDSFGVSLVRKLTMAFVYKNPFSILGNVQWCAGVKT
jgi:hypothetical protein